MENYWSRHADVKKDELESAPFSMYGEVSDAWTEPESGHRYEGNYVPVWRWRQAMWNDFQCRMDWTVKPYEEANHHPRAVVNGDESDQILRLSAEVGASLTLDASSSSDPDHDELTFRWYCYPEPGTYDGGIELVGQNSDRPNLVIPADASGAQIHVILEVSDVSSIASLTDYRRIVIDVE